MFISQDHYSVVKSMADITTLSEDFRSIRDKLNVIDGVAFAGATVLDTCRINVVCTQGAFPQLLLILKALSVHAVNTEPKLHSGVYGKDVFTFDLNIPENLELTKQAFEQAIDNRVNFSEDDLYPSEENMKLVNEHAARALYNAWIDHLAGKDYSISAAAILGAMSRFKEINTVDLIVSDKKIKDGHWTRTLAILNYWSAKGFKTYYDLYNELENHFCRDLTITTLFLSTNKGILSSFAILMPVHAVYAAQSVFRHLADEILLAIKDVQDATDKSMLLGE